jgi:hypothetical protein
MFNKYKELFEGCKCYCCGTRAAVAAYSIDDNIEDQEYHVILEEVKALRNFYNE